MFGYLPSTMATYGDPSDHPVLVVIGFQHGDRQGLPQYSNVRPPGRPAGTTCTTCTSLRLSPKFTHIRASVSYSSIHIVSVLVLYSPIIIASSC